ncbi:MAG: hypothetical protein ACLQDL_02385 [Spirochaetia bacterium]
MSNPFPRTTVAGVSLSRMVIGTNWILGYSHTSAAADEGIRKRNCSPEAIAEILEAFLESGVDTIMVEMRGRAAVLDAMKRTEDATGKRIIRVDTPVINVDDSPAARREAEAVIADSARNGATFCLPHHSSVEQLVLKNSRAIPRLPDYLSMIRDHGMIPGLSAHMPELVVFSDLNGYDVETYVQIYNCAGFLMQVEIEYVHAIIWNARKPVMTIKPMAAGRVSPFVGLTFAFATIRERDMVTVGCLSAPEAREDVEIGMAALERRPPRLAGRDSVNTTPIMAKATS